jgi:O-antigen ligase
MIGEGRVSLGFPSSVKRGLRLLAVASAVLLAGALVAVSSQTAFWLLGLVGVAGYVLLAYVRPFAAFVVLALFALTVRLSGLEVVGGISAMIGLGLVFTIVWLSRLALRAASLARVREYGLLLGMIVVVLISALLNRDGPAGPAPVLTYLQLFLLFVLVVNLVTSPSQLHTLGGAIIASSTLLAAAILLEQAGWLPAALVREQAVGVYTGSGMEIVARTGGLWGDANFTAVQLTVALPFIVEWWPIRRDWWKRALLLGAAAAILTAFSFTFSVSGLMGLCVILLTKAIRDPQRGAFQAIARTSMLAITAFWALSVILPDLYVQRALEKVGELVRAVSTLDRDLLLRVGTNRGDTWQSALQAIGDSPLIGHGPGNASYANVQYSILRGSTEHIAAHNMFLTVAGDLGLAGLASFVGLIVSAVFAVKSSSEMQATDSVLMRDGAALFIALLAVAVQGLALDLHTLKLLWVLLGMAIAYRQLCVSAHAAAPQPKVMN